MQDIKFVGKVSKGSRFNQVYIPKYIENKIEAGDLVEIRLIEKSSLLYCSKGLKLSEFKKTIIKKILSIADSFDGIDYAFVVGSFLTEDIGYNDIDILIISEKKIEDAIYHRLIKELNLKFHILILKKGKFEYLLKACPLTRAMLDVYVSNKKFTPIFEKVIDKNHINFLLMMPNDLLKIKMDSRVFYDNIRRLITIERFLDNKKLNTKHINDEVKNLIKEPLYHKIKNNESVEDKSYKILREIIVNKLNIIEKWVKIRT